MAFLNIKNKIRALHRAVVSSICSHKDKSDYLDSLYFMDNFYKYSRKMYAYWAERAILVHKPCPICESQTTALCLDKSLIDGGKYYKCTKCDFVYVNPFVPEKAYNEIYVTGYDGLDEWWRQSRIKHGYIKIRGKHACEKPARVKMLSPMWKFLDPNAGGIFLDFGCGIGDVLVEAATKFDVFGLEMDEGRLATARVQLNDPSGIRIKRFSGEDMAMFHEKFDVIHTNQVVEHLLDPVKYFTLFSSWLKPGGYLYISCPAGDSFAFKFLNVNNSMAALGHVSLFNKKSLSLALAKANLELGDYHSIDMDVSGIEWWRVILRQKFTHRHSYITNPALVSILYPLSLITTTFLEALHRLGILRGNYFIALAKKPG